MVDPSSRYAALSQASLVWTDALGRQIRYLPRRFLLPADAFELLAEAVVEGGERLDQVAARTLGAADAWWRVADANDVLDPGALTAEPGARLRVPVPRP
jgi:hypothetical protein